MRKIFSSILLKKMVSCKQYFYGTVSVISSDFKMRVRPRERFLDPLPTPPINFVHDHFFSPEN